MGSCAVRECTERRPAPPNGDGIWYDHAGPQGQHPWKGTGTTCLLSQVRGGEEGDGGLGRLLIEISSG